MEYDLHSGLVAHEYDPRPSTNTPVSVCTEAARHSVAPLPLLAQAESQIQRLRYGVGCGAETCP